MISELRKAAARANGSKSRGPRTAQGKANSSRNSLQHGLRSQVLFPGHTTDGAWQSLLTEYHGNFHPRSETEMSLVRTLAICQWRTRHLWKLETDLLNRRIMREKRLEPASGITPAGQIPHTPIFRAFYAVTNDGCGLELITRWQARISRLYYLALHRLWAIQARPAMAAFENTFINNRTQQLIENKQSPESASPRSAPVQSEDQRNTVPARQQSVGQSPSPRSTFSTSATISATTAAKAAS